MEIIVDREIYCPNCCNYREVIDPEGKSCFDTIPCPVCRPKGKKSGGSDR